MARSLHIAGLAVAVCAFVCCDAARVPAQTIAPPDERALVIKRLLSRSSDPLPLRCRFSRNANGTLGADCSMDRLSGTRWFDNHEAIANRAFSFTGTTTGLYTASNLATEETARMALRSVTNNEKLIERAAPQILKLAKAPNARAAMIGAIVTGAGVWIYETYKSYQTPQAQDSVRLIGVVPSQ